MQAEVLGHLSKRDIRAVRAHKGTDLAGQVNALGHRDVHRVRHTKRAGPRYRSHLAARNPFARSRTILTVNDTPA